MPNLELPFELNLYSGCSPARGETLYQRQLFDEIPKEGVICCIFRHLKDLEAIYGDTQAERLFLHAYAPAPPQDVTPTLPPISTITTPYAPTAPSINTSDAALNPPYTFFHPPNALRHLPCLRLHTLKNSLQRRPPPTTYNPYAAEVPSRYAAEATFNLPNPLCHLPSLCSHSVLLTCHQCCSHTGLILNTPYHPYAPAAPSRLDYYAAPHLRPHHSLYSHGTLNPPYA
ncbi:hypothetical protein O181_064854 [Austropuccinia psidii MF-1]|uniref:Uncharacterized protein n=1 Tax=Austropuccinia psidii MF-1 TaxID=1389203 RepID=A0A9Q3EQD0_9BASI|nr:hypothetical protein [Austropuccinia psidii MF-1]